jgi:CBS domain-containing protein
MRCEEIMKRGVRTVRESDLALAAAVAMRDDDIGFLPVCDPDGKAIGVVTDRDIAMRVCAADARASAMTVADVMTRSVVACRPHQAIARAESLMRRHRITRVLVTDDAGVLVGVVSLSDLAQYERSSAVGRTMRAISERKYAPERP